MTKKKEFKLPDLKTTLLTGAISVFVIGGLFVAIKQRAIEVLAAPDDIKQLKSEQAVLAEQTTTIGAYVQQKIKEEDFNERQKKAAPAGMRWDSDQQAYVKVK